MQGVILDSYETVKKLIDKTTTTKGLKVVSRIVDKKYSLGETVNKKEIEYHRVEFNQVLPQLSYVINLKSKVV